MAVVVVYRDREHWDQVACDAPEFRIGRSPDSDLHLDDESVSRQHARLERSDEGYYVVDLNSTNGVYVNGRRIKRGLLHDGDTIVVGKRRLQFLARPVHEAATVPGDQVVRVERAWKEYALGTRSVTALKDVSIAIGSGEFMAIAGPSGSGKSTLLNLIGCIDTPTRGSVFIGGQEVSRQTPDQLADLRAHELGFIFQTFNLLPVLSAWENVEYPLLQRRDLGRRQRRKRVEHYLEVVGLAKFTGQRPNELSGGQRQRVAIARALATRPRIVLADEPTANLDHRTGEGILQLMKQLNGEEGTTFIFSTHDPRVMELADRTVNLSDGEVIS